MTKYIEVGVSLDASADTHKEAVPDNWDALSPVERFAFAEDVLNTHVSNHVDSYVAVVDDEGNEITDAEMHPATREELREELALKLVEQNIRFHSTGRNTDPTPEELQEYWNYVLTDRGREEYRTKATELLVLILDQA